MPIPHASLSPFRAGLAGLRRALRWSNTRQAWQERLGAAAVTAGVLALVIRGGSLTGWQRVGAWALLLLAVAILFRRGWVRLFGPVLFYDLVRSTRRAR